MHLLSNESSLRVCQTFNDIFRTALFERVIINMSALFSLVIYTHKITQHLLSIFVIWIHIDISWVWYDLHWMLLSNGCLRSLYMSWIICYNFRVHVYIILVSLGCKWKITISTTIKYLYSMIWQLDVRQIKPWCLIQLVLLHYIRLTRPCQHQSR